jgi:hypothetical protein
MLRAAADDRDHLAKTLLLAEVDQFLEERAADAGALRLRYDIDAVFYRVAVSGTWPVGSGISVPQNLFTANRDEMRKALLDNALPAFRHLGCARRIDLVGGGAVQNRLGVDSGDRRNVALFGRTEQEIGWHRGRGLTRRVPGVEAQGQKENAAPKRRVSQDSCSSRPSCGCSP